MWDDRYGSGGSCASTPESKVYLDGVHPTGFSSADDFATIFLTQDIPELVAVASALEKGLGVWVLVAPADAKRQCILTASGTDSLDLLPAGQIAGLHFPVGIQASSMDAPWAKAVIGLLDYQFDWASRTVAVGPVYHGGSLIALVGVTGEQRSGKLPPSSLIQGVALAVRRLHELAELRRDIAGYQFLLLHQAKSVVLVEPGGKIMNGTEAGLAVVGNLRSRNQGTPHRDDGLLPGILQSALERDPRHIILDDMQAHISTLLLESITTVAPLHAIHFSRRLTTPKPANKDGLPNLTPTERRVYPLLLAGLRNKEIGDKLNISVHTAKHHVSSILSKAGCSDRLLLLAKATGSNAGAHPELPPMERVRLSSSSSIPSETGNLT